jgi:hypothetical protein
MLLERLSPISTRYVLPFATQHWGSQFLEGLVEGIGGMRCGGIRRVSFRSDAIPGSWKRREMQELLMETRTLSLGEPFGLQCILRLLTGTQQKYGYSKSRESGWMASSLFENGGNLRISGSRIWQRDSRVCIRDPGSFWPALQLISTVRLLVLVELRKSTSIQI